ncbi:MAG: hypothetical protein ACT4QE_05420 [Anaerolineales bacterium]
MRRPRSLTFVCIILLGLSLFNLLGAASVYQRWDFLSRQSLAISPLYFAIGDGMWTAAFGALTFGLWRRAGWARTATLFAYGLYLAHGWLNRLLFAQADFVAVTYGWTACVDVVSYLGIATILWRPVVRAWFNLKSAL